MEATRPWRSDSVPRTNVYLTVSHLRQDESRSPGVQPVNDGGSRLSVFEVRGFTDNPKRNLRIQRKLFKKAMVDANYVKVSFDFWDVVRATGRKIEHNGYVVAVESEVRLYSLRLQTRVAFMARWCHPQSSRVEQLT